MSKIIEVEQQPALTDEELDMLRDLSERFFDMRIAQLTENDDTFGRLMQAGAFLYSEIESQRNEEFRRMREAAARKLRIYLRPGIELLFYSPQMNLYSKFIQEHEGWTVRWICEYCKGHGIQVATTLRHRTPKAILYYLRLKKQIKLYEIKYNELGRINK